MRAFAGDLHIHTALSPCAADEMTPPAIVRAAREQGLGVIAVCDHNAAGNVAAVMTAAKSGHSPEPAANDALRTRPPGKGARRAPAPGNARPHGSDPRDLTVLAGMEITTAEEVHVVGLFPTPEAAGAAADVVQDSLPVADAAYYARFGAQSLMDADGGIVGQERRMLAAAPTLELSAAVALIHRHGGVAIAAHVDRPSFSVLSQLGVFPTDAGFDAIEVFTPCAARVAAAPDLARFGLPIVASSDSHFPADVGRARTILEMAAPTFDELVLALRGVGGRRVRIA